VLTSTPSPSSTASRRIAACSSRTAAYRSPSSCSSRVDPSMSVNRKVTVPVGSALCDRRGGGPDRSAGSIAGTSPCTCRRRRPKPNPTSIATAPSSATMLHRIPAGERSALPEPVHSAAATATAMTPLRRVVLITPGFLARSAGRRLPARGSPGPDRPMRSPPGRGCMLGRSSPGLREGRLLRLHAVKMVQQAGLASAVSAAVGVEPARLVLVPGQDGRPSSSSGRRATDARAGHHPTVQREVGISRCGAPGRRDGPGRRPPTPVAQHRARHAGHVGPPSSRMSFSLPRLAATAALTLPTAKGARSRDAPVEGARSISLVSLVLSPISSSR
jgi:hypothetical protein